MKKFIIALLFALDLYGESMLIGAGAYVQTQPYSNMNAQVLPSPLIFYSDDIFYVRWTRVGAYFLGSKGDELSWGFSLTAKPRPYGYKNSDAAIVSDMGNRNSTIEAGVAFSASTDYAYFESIYLADILENSDSFRVENTLGSDFKFGNLAWYPCFVAYYNSDTMMNYYYGVKRSESTQAHPYFKATHGWQFAFDNYFKYPLQEDWFLFINLRADRLPDDVYKSPIVQDKFIYSGVVSLLYSIEL